MSGALSVWGTIMRAWIAGGAGFLLACAPPPQQGLAEKPNIDGRYIVTAIDGEPPVINIAGYNPTVTIAGPRVHFQSQCIYADWTLTQTAGGVRATPYYEPGSAMCARGLAPGESAIEDAFSGLSAIAPTPMGGLQIAGGGHTLELRRAPSDKTASLVGSWRLESIDGRRVATPIELEGDAQRLWWEPACALQMRSYTVDGTRFDAPARDSSGREVCDIGYPLDLTEAWRVVEAADTIERSANGRITLSGGERSLTLVPR